MKQVIFKSISVSNFLSIGDEPVTMRFNQGINLITGSNKDKPDRRNAIGKSSIADAIYFAIFGETLRELKKDLIVNNITGGNTCVVLEFSVTIGNTTAEYKIVRQLNPSKVSVSENDVDVTRDTIANTNKYICDLISASQSIFQNCIIMTVNNAVPFMAKNKVEKRKFIEDIFGLEVFSEMLSILRSEYNDLKKQFDVENSKLEEVTGTLSAYNGQRQKLLDHRAQKLEIYKARQKNNTVEKQKLITELNEFVEINDVEIKAKISKLNDGLNICEEKITNNLQSITELKTKIKYLENSFSKIGTTEDTCPVCLRGIEDHDHQFINSEKEKISGEVAKLSADIIELANKVKNLKTKKEAIKNSIEAANQIIVEYKLQEQKKSSTREKIEQIDRWQESLVQDIEQVSSTDTDFDQTIIETEQRVSELSQKVADYTNTFNTLDVVKYVVSEEGVKSYIVNKLLAMLNGKLAYYLNKLDSNALCYFNEFFEEEIVNEKNKICSYFNFSGAERKAIDLACLFTFSDLRRMQGGVHYNIAIYDELFDSSFDEKGLELVTDILKERAEKFGECIYIISHRKESLKAVTGDVIFLEKQNGITRRVEFSESMI